MFLIYISIMFLTISIIFQRFYEFYIKIKQILIFVNENQALLMNLFDFANVHNRIAFSTFMQALSPVPTAFEHAFQWLSMGLRLVA